MKKITVTMATHRPPSHSMVGSGFGFQYSPSAVSHGLASTKNKLDKHQKYRVYEPKKNKNFMWESPVKTNTLRLRDRVGQCPKPELYHIL